MNPTRAYEIIAWVSEGGIDCFTPPKDKAEAIEAAKVFMQTAVASAPGRMGRAAAAILREEA